MPKQASQPIDVWNGFRFDNPGQVRYLRSNAWFRLLSSGYGSGKSKLLCRASIATALEYPGARLLLARLKSTELHKSTHQTFKRELREIGLIKGKHYEYNKNESTYYWANGSETWLTHLEDGERFGSAEFSQIDIDEGSEVPDAVFEVLTQRLRWDVGPHRMSVATNPGASGFLRKIVYGEIDGTGTANDYGIEDRFEWIPVPPGANKHNPPGYNDRLARLGKAYGPHWYARYVEGSWDSFEGQRFPMFDREIHVLDHGFAPPAEWTVVEGWDFGYRETFVAWIGVDPTGWHPPVVFDELQMQETEADSVADRVWEKRKFYDIKPIAMGDPAGVGTTQLGGPSPIEHYARYHGIYIAPCKQGKSPTSRADLLAAFLSERRKQRDGEKPGILFTENCPAVVNSIVNLRWDLTMNTKGEDPREKFVKKDDHGFDALTYGLVGVPPPNMPEPEKPQPLPGVNVGAQAALAEVLPEG